MKIETKKQEFQPVVITLETQEEVDQMFSLANFNEFDEVNDITQKLMSLENMIIHVYNPQPPNESKVVVFI